MWTSSPESTWRKRHTCLLASLTGEAYSNTAAQSDSYTADALTVRPDNIWHTDTCILRGMLRKAKKKSMFTKLLDATSIVTVVWVGSKRPSPKTIHKTQLHWNYSWRTKLNILVMYTITMFGDKNGLHRREITWYHCKIWLWIMVVASGCRAFMKMALWTLGYCIPKPSYLC